jgi:hypothetical protein
MEEYIDKRADLLIASTQFAKEAKHKRQLEQGQWNEAKGGKKLRGEA